MRLLKLFLIVFAIRKFFIPHKIANEKLEKSNHSFPNNLVDENHLLPLTGKEKKKLVAEAKMKREKKKLNYQKVGW